MSLRRHLAQERLLAEGFCGSLHGARRRPAGARLPEEARRRGRARGHARSRASPRPSGSSSPAPSSRRGRSSAASARRGSWCARSPCSTAARGATGRRSPRRSTATCAAAPATCASSTPSRPRPRRGRPASSPAARRDGPTSSARRTAGCATTGAAAATRTASAPASAALPRHRPRPRPQAVRRRPAGSTGMLHAAVVLAAHPARPGARDRPGAGARDARRGPRRSPPPTCRASGSSASIVRDWPVFVAVGETTRCVGDVLALVVADSQPRARRAAAAVAVAYEVLEPITSPEQALAPGAPALHAARQRPRGVRVRPRRRRRRAGVVGPRRVRRASRPSASSTPSSSPRRASRSPADRPGDGDRGRGPGDSARWRQVYSQGQGVHDDQAQIAAVLGVPQRARVIVELVSNGGAFGGKEDLSIQAQTALAAHLLGRPVRTVLTREQSILMHPKRHPLTLDYTVGCDAEGRLTAVRARIVGDTGAYASVGAKVLERAAGHSCGPVPGAQRRRRGDGRSTPTTRPCGAMRGFGANQAAFAIEGMHRQARGAGRARRLRHPRAQRPRAPATASRPARS